MVVRSTLAAKVERTVRRYELFPPGATLVVACSGGADSTALLYLLRELQESWELQLVVAHVHHGLRGEEADQDEAFVRALAQRWELPFEVIRLNSLGEGSGNLEDRARRERYDFLAAVAVRYGGVVVTGHTLDDQAETFLLKLFRGSGPGGLSGIARRRRHVDPGSGRSVAVVRPLLEVSHEQLVEYLQARGGSFREDRTNRELRFDRNWVRWHLLPELRSRLNPRVEAVLARTAGLLGEIETFLEEELDRHFGSGPASATEGVAIPLDAWSRLPGALRKVALRRLIAAARGSLEGISYRHVAALEALAEGPSGRRAVLPGEWVAEKDFDYLWLGRPSEPVSLELEVPVPGEVALPQLGKRVAIRPAASDDRSPLRSAASRLVLRTRRSGDRVMLPDGTTRRLKRVLMERRVPRHARERRLLLAEGTVVLWVEGVGGFGRAEDPAWRVEVETFPVPKPSH
ncbi:MAG: tRNA lysidine(34) synthetase TilS [Acidobacteriota bacterium]